MDTEKCILERRSTRAFTEQKVSRGELEKIVAAGLYAPSAMNEQPWRFTVVSNAEVLNRLNLAVKALMSKADEERIRSRSTDGSYCFYYRAPTLIIVSCAPARFPAADAACALENMFLQAHALGLGSCWINQLCGEACDDKAVRDILAELGVPKDHKVYGCAAIGHIGKQTPLKERVGDVAYID